MNKLTFLIIISLTLLTSCQTNQIVKTHGISYLEKREKLIIVKKSNKNDVIKLMGQPATRGMTNNNTWIYIERSRTRGKLRKLGRNYLKKNNVLVLEFNDYGIVFVKEFYNKDNMKNIKFTENVTENKLRKENFVYGFLSSLRQKMQSRKK